MVEVRKTIDLTGQEKVISVHNESTQKHTSETKANDWTNEQQRRRQRKKTNYTHKTYERTVVVSKAVITNHTGKKVSKWERMSTRAPAIFIHGLLSVRVFFSFSSFPFHSNLSRILASSFCVFFILFLLLLLCFFLFHENCSAFSAQTSARSISFASQCLSIRCRIFYILCLCDCFRSSFVLHTRRHDDQFFSVWTSNRLGANREQSSTIPK